MCADGDPSSSNHTEPLARRDGSFALSERWGGHAQVAVDADEAMVLHQDFEFRLDPSSGCGSLCQAPLLRLTRPAVPVDRRHGGGFPPGDGWQARVDRTVKRCTRDLRVAQALAWVAGPRLRRQHSELRREPLLRRIIDRPFALTNAFESRASVRCVFLVTLIPCFFNQAVCSACALVSAAVLGRLVGLPFGVDILITRDIRLAPADASASILNSGADVALYGHQDAAMSGFRNVATLLNYRI